MSENDEVEFCASVLGLPMGPTLYADRGEWLKARGRRIGGSDAAAVLGKSPFMTNERLWEIKTGRREQDDISDLDVVQYGTEAEEHLRELFQLDFPDYYVGYEPHNMFVNEDYPFAHASLDGWLVKDGRLGILEIKTALINTKLQSLMWKDQIPEYYYCQVIHYLMVTGFEFAILKAQLKHQIGDELPYLQTRHYMIERKDVEADIKYLAEKEKEFWEYVVKDKRPATILPAI